MNKQLVKTILAIFVALNLTAIGVQLFVNANLGSDTITVLEEGISVFFKTSIGNGAKIYNGLTLLIAIIFARKNLGWSTFAFALLVGFVIDLYNPVFMALNLAKASIVIRILAIVIGQIMFCISFALLVHYRKGMNQIDAISYLLTEKTGIDYKYIRTAFDVLFIVTGFLMGGTVGVGSIFAMCTTGIITNFFIKIFAGK